MFQKYTKDPPITVVLVIGGVSAADQLREIDRGVDILIGTPGRVDDFISTKKVLSMIVFYHKLPITKIVGYMIKARRLFAYNIDI